MASAALSKAHQQIMRLQASTKRAREKAGEVMETALVAAETAGAAFAFGIWEGKIDKAEDFELFGVPMPLAAGVAAHAFALLGIGRGMEPHMHALGNGALAAHLNGLGRKMGTDWRAKNSQERLHGTPYGQVGEGDGSRQGVGVTEADLLTLARA